MIQYGMISTNVSWTSSFDNTAHKLNPYRLKQYAFTKEEREKTEEQIGAEKPYPPLCRKFLYESIS